MKFLTVGGVSVLTDVGAFYGCVRLLGWPIAPATVVAFLLSLVVSFGLNKAWVFGSRGTSVGLGVRELTRYVVLLVVNVVVTIAAIRFAVAVLEVDPVLVKIACVAVTTLWNYPAYKFFVFRRVS